MITLSQKAVERIEKFIEQDPKRPTIFRVVVRGQDKDGFIYEFLLQRQEAVLDSDHRMETGTFTTVVDAGSMQHLKGSSIDWFESVKGSGFQVQNPNQPTKIIKSPSLETLRDFVEHDINPAIAQHRGFAQVEKYEDGKVYVKMGGGCQGCSSAAVTLRLGIEERIKTVFPDITDVIDLTDHSAGTNPYYA